MQDVRQTNYCLSRIGFQRGAFRRDWVYNNMSSLDVNNILPVMAFALNILTPFLCMTSCGYAIQLIALLSASISLTL